ncbi:MFS transporter [Streptomyces sp. NPDC006711]|uniref:MFS transporter n=1 Tax=Streptomyces sp. NPDC006711 TaxID=3364762 RepID=UPI0036BE7027
MTRAQTLIGFIVCVTTILLAVLDMNIVSAATVPIARDLDPAHGVDKIPWLISAFALASAAALPLYGKLCDSLGAKKVLVGSLAVFLLGSALCGAAQSMPELIAARALQGLGGGGLMSVTMVVLAQLSPAGGSRASGAGGIVGGTGMAIGPWIGGTLADHANWRWIFYLNLPLGLAALVGAVLVLKLPVSSVRHRVDYLGAALAAAFTSTLLLATSWGGKQYAWDSPEIIGLIVACVLALALFLRRQTRATEPVLPLSMFKVPQLRYGFAIQGLLGAAMMGALVYVMVYLQTVRGIEPAAAGLYLIPMALGMTAVGLGAGRLAERGWRTKTFVLTGTTACALGLATLATLDTATSLWLIRAALLLMGCGFGLLIGQLIPYVQGAAPVGQLGIATTSIRFFQTLGNALGAAVFGTLLSRVYETKVPGGSTSAIARLTRAARERATHGFTGAMDVVFLVAAGVMVVAAVLAARLPDDVRPAPAEEAAEEAADEPDLVAAWTRVGPVPLSRGTGPTR